MNGAVLTISVILKLRTSKRVEIIGHTIQSKCYTQTQYLAVSSSIRCFRQVCINYSTWCVGLVFMVEYDVETTFPDRSVTALLALLLLRSSALRFADNNFPRCDSRLPEHD